MTPAQIKLARAFARKFGSFSDRDEAYSIALLAVWRASQTWKADGGMTFASWAAWYCRRALGDQRRRQARWWGLTAGVDPSLTIAGRRSGAPSRSSRRPSARLSSSCACRECPRSTPRPTSGRLDKRSQIASRRHRKS